MFLKVAADLVVRKAGALPSRPEVLAECVARALPDSTPSKFDSAFPTYEYFREQVAIFIHSSSWRDRLRYGSARVLKREAGKLKAGQTSLSAAIHATVRQAVRVRTRLAHVIVVLDSAVVCEVARKGMTEEHLRCASRRQAFWRSTYLDFASRIGLELPASFDMDSFARAVTALADGSVRFTHLGRTAGVDGRGDIEERMAEELNRAVQSLVRSALPDVDLHAAWRPSASRPGDKMSLPPAATATAVPSCINLVDPDFLGLSPETFERLIVDVLSAEGFIDARLHGERGQKQHGVDGMAWLDNGVGVIVFQAKRTVRLTANDLSRIVAEFDRSALRLPIGQIVIATAAEVRDTRTLQRLAHLRAETPVPILLWDRAHLAVALRKHPSLRARYFGCTAPGCL